MSGILLDGFTKIISGFVDRIVKGLIYTKDMHAGPYSS
jgi:hypothetical protein